MKKPQTKPDRVASMIEGRAGPSWRWRALAYGALVAATVAVYGQAVRFGFINLDDDRYVTHNAHVQQGLTLDNVAWAFTTGDVANWHPLTWLSYLLDFSLFGLKPGAFHLVNVLLHVLNAWLLLEALRRLTGRFWPSAFVAFAFALHPLHVESVAWVAERKDVLSTAFWLLTMLAYAAYVKRSGIGRGETKDLNDARDAKDRRVGDAETGSSSIGRAIGWYGLAVLLFALGLMAKPMLVTLPCVLLLLDYWPLGRWRRGARVWLVVEKMPFFALALVSSVITMAVQGQAISAMTRITMDQRLSNAVVSYVTYLVKTVWPFGLAVYYPHPGNSLPLWEVAGAILLLGAITVAVLLTVRTRPYLAVGWLWYAGTLVPVIGLVQVGGQGMADRYTYVSLIGAFIMIAWGGADAIARWHVLRRPAAVVGAVALVALGVIAGLQARLWRDCLTLYEHTLRVTHDNYLIHYNLGLKLFEDVRVPEAIEQFKEALHIQPAYVNAQLNLGKALSFLGRVDEAIEVFRDRLRRDEGDVQARDNLATLLAKKGLVDEAIEEFSEVVRLDPAQGTAHFNLANLLARKGRRDEAVAHYRAALACDAPAAHAPSALNLGMDAVRQGKNDEAMQWFQDVLRFDPRNSEALNNIGLLLALEGNLDEAIPYYNKALEMNPGNVRARQNLREAEAAKAAGAAPEKS